MAPVPNPRYLFLASPAGWPDLSKDFQYDDSRTIDPDTVELNGGFITKTQFLSVDPYMRGRMNAGTFMAWQPGEPWTGFGICEVLRSETPEFQKGDTIYGHLPFEHYTVHCIESAHANMFRVIKNTENIPLSVYLGVAGLPGKTGYYGLKAIGEPKAGESIYVSTAAGVVGTVVCQIAKEWGLRVLGSTGSDEKVKFLQEDVGIDAFNYKTSCVDEAIKDFGGLDIYWDNVGAEMLDTALINMNHRGRIVICGHIAEYNVPDEKKRGIKHTWEMVYKEIRMQGLYVFSYEEQYADEFYATVPKMVAEGKLKYTEDITVGLEHAGELLMSVLKGQNTGKAILQMYP
ncbi:alcohol dehydrogenase [Dacryopinax primogenitus]|uniref:Alcohol dehydrogenase n=1 Tax=Dacryopinax primogenitus (strain DJM 731) TaxID=1858805 RepID=M5FV59_DACPD|nr:alcohol dehydrogenase [Dacryopinax primogenitus]EJU01661.1 alcohol dehydrogenase [Dacryopinax primogenitus]